jgi:hypothetical protein
MHALSDDVQWSMVQYVQLEGRGAREQSQTFAPGRLLAANLCRSAWRTLPVGLRQVRDQLPASVVSGYLNEGQLTAVVCLEPASRQTARTRH